MREPILADAIDVHLIGQPWWESAVPYLALVLSLLSLGLTIYFQFRGDARIKVTAGVGMSVFGVGATGDWKLRLVATNTGRTGQTVVESISLQRSDGAGLAKIPEPTDTSLPCPLAPGAHANLYLDVTELLSKVSDKEIDGLLIAVSTGHGDVKEPLPDSAKKQLKSIRQL